MDNVQGPVVVTDVDVPGSITSRTNLGNYNNNEKKTNSF